jgi:thymidine phosphorylase
MGVDTYKEAVVYMHKDCHVCQSEGFEVHSRVRLTIGDHAVIATLNMVRSNIIRPGEVGVSEYAWQLLDAKPGDEVLVSHPKPITSLSQLRSKIYGHELDDKAYRHIITDITAGKYSDIHISSFLTACAGGRMALEEIIGLTKAMTSVGDSLSWGKEMVVDKHCVGGLPGNRTTPIIVAIVAAFGLTMPKTSSRAITSPAGTADTMEVLTSVDIPVSQVKQVVEKEHGCMVWGGAIALSPADDILIRVEKALDLDSEGQMVASILSKKIAAGSTHVLVDIPIGETAKVRSQVMAEQLKYYLEVVGDALGIYVKVIFSDGSQPIGHGIGPALEARDVLCVLQNKPEAPQDLRTHALNIAGHVLEFSPDVEAGQGVSIANDMLTSGKAWKKFQAICEAQGGLKSVPEATYVHVYRAHSDGRVAAIDNRRLATIAKLAGAPADKAAGIDLHVKLDMPVVQGQPLFTIHAESPGELEYALSYLKQGNNIIHMEAV